MVPIAATITSGLLVQAAVKTYDQFHGLAQSVPILDIEAIEIIVADHIAAEIVSQRLSDRFTSSDLAAIRKLFESVDLGQLASDELSLHLLGEPSPSASATRRFNQLLKIYGASPECAVAASPKLAEILGAVVVQIAGEGLTIPPPKKGSTEKDKRASAQAALTQRKASELALLGARLNDIADIIDTERIDLNDLEIRLRRLNLALGQTHGKLTPPSMAGVTKVEFSELYVPPRLRDSSNASITLASAFDGLVSHGQKSVILGTPGAGKTTLASFCANQISANWGKLAVQSCFIVVLREHTQTAPINRGLAIIDAIRATCKERYQVKFSEAEIAFVCSSGRALVVLDGLDEMLNLGSRVSVATSVDNFAKLYERTSIVVTSRLTGYDQAPLDERMFKTFTIDDFSDAQVESYASRWFQLDTDLSPNEREGLVRSFLEESSDIRDLRSNGLLLGLLCSLYKRQEHLPQNRTQIYADCTKLLFDQWDRRRNLRPTFDFEAHINGAVQHLAAWVFTSQDRTGGVVEDDYVEEAASYFEVWQYGSKAESTLAATSFIDFCTGRAWILTDIGSTPSGVRLFGFTHRTFLEYFTALHLTRSLGDEDLAELLVEKSGQSSWFMVCQLIVSLSAIKSQGLENALVERVCKSLATRRIDLRDVTVAVIVSSVRNVPMRPATVQMAVRSSVNYYLNRVRRSSSQRLTDRRQIWLGATGVAIENRSIATPEVLRLFAERLRYSHTEIVPGEKWLNLVSLVEYLLRNSESIPDVSASLQSMDLSFLRRDMYASASAPQVLISALLGGIPIDVSGIQRRDLRSLMTGSLDGSIGPIAGRWGEEELPSALEVSVLWLSHADESQVLQFQQSVEPLIEFGVQTLSGSWAASLPSFTPTWSWWRPTLHRGRSPVELGPIAYPSILTGYGLAALLSEAYIERSDDEEGRKSRVTRMIYRDWGRFAAMPAALRLKYVGPDPGIEAELSVQCPELSTWASGALSALDFVRHVIGP